MKNKMTFTGQGLAHPEASQKVIYRASESDISVIKFEGAKVRIVKVAGEPWFVASDVCRALEISNTTEAVSALDSDEVMTLTLTEGHSGKRGGARSWNMVAESGFYKLIARSRKAAAPGTLAHRFTNWVFREVIPSIRKTGSYGVPFAFLNDHSKRKAAYDKKASKRGKDLQACKGEKSRLIAEEAELWRKYQPQLPEVH
ncbi:antirepressor protein [Enterobacter roggenkampii]|uniref:BRO-N domain-containing protein n=1 Tax=Enterobacter roggenkampii TaxID=1812935 RepID=UPI0020203470|nr:BRO family protein [Enterobacter roggenkampii]MCL8139404.1 antirepressor protein [Enterobacter roggenkampii]MCM8147653.1 antirepressor protein [Enterobacter roggenkampii]